MPDDALDIAGYLVALAMILVGVLGTLVIAVDGVPVPRSHVVEHGCAVYDCDDEGNCTFQWRDEQPGGQGDE